MGLFTDDDNENKTKPKATKTAVSGALRGSSQSRKAQIKAASTGTAGPKKIVKKKAD